MATWSTNRYYFLAAKTIKFEGEEDATTAELDVVNTLRPAIRFLNIFGQFPCRLPDKEKQPQKFIVWVLQLVYSIGIVTLLFGFWVSHTYQYRMRVFEEHPCKSAACVLRQLPPFVYGFLVFFISFHSFCSYRKFNLILVEWNRIIRMIKNCFQNPLDTGSVRDDQTYNLSRRRIVWFSLAYYGTSFFEHAIGDVYITYNCVRLFDDKCDFFNYYWGVITHRKELPDRSPITSFLIFVASKYALVVWNMTDFLVMVFCQCLIRNFDGYNRLLEEFVKEPKSRGEWKHMRKVHFKLCELVQRINSVLSPAIFVTTSTVIFFICHQVYFHLYISMKSSAETNFVEMSHGVLSFSQLVFRITGVCLIGATLSDKAKAPLKILRQCDMDGSTVEVQRFWDEVVDSNVSVTALKLFNLNRFFLLTVFGIVITYEMIFLSLNEN